jgi:pimeloyl-ACP methyl ester carboxylesterase
MINKLLFEIKKTDEYENGLDKVLEKLPPRYRKLFDTPYLNEEYLTNYCKIIGEGAKLDIKDLVKNIDVPVFIVSAKDDKIVSEKQFEWAKNNIKGIKSLCVSAATHWFLTENGEDAANELITLWSQMPEEIKWVL